MMSFLAVASLLVLPAAACAPPAVADGVAQELRTPLGPLSDAEFVEVVEALSEPGGYFDTDNLISNESSYLHVDGALRRRGVRGGAYIGVGPDQNFSYLTTIQPEVAFIIDIRADNLLQHLWFKALFELATDRLEFLALLYGRPLPEDHGAWRQRPLERLVEWIDTQPAQPDSGAAVRERVGAYVAAFGFDLDEESLGTIDRFHREFIRDGLDLRFHSFGRPPRWFYPTHRDLLLEKNLDGQQVSYLTNDTDFQALKTLQERNLVIPVVGNLAGPHALRAIGDWIRERGLTVSAFYTSNIEFYLWGDGTFPEYADNVSSLPLGEGGVLIRSYFGGGFFGGDPGVQAVPGYYSVQLMQPLDVFLEAGREGGFRGYSDLIARRAIPLQP